VSAWGPGNSLSATPAFDPLFQARSGLIEAQGGDDRPVTSGMLVHDIGTGSLAAFGILVALYARHRSGRGQEVATTMAAASIMLQAGEFTQVAGRAPSARGGRDHPGPTATQRLYPCCDGWLALAVETEPELDALGRALDLTLQPSWLGAANRGPEAEAIQAVLRRTTAAEAVDRLTAEGAPAATVLRRYGQFADSWFRQHDAFQHIDDPELGRCTVFRTYARWSRSASGASGPAAAPGADTVKVLAGIGYDEAAITALITAGVARNPHNEDT
jgi:crotonobetainyl-CoA:carnitine CoA-transferase CaiB-like acyl-CoA transferase